MTRDDGQRVHALVARHAELTGSARAREILAEDERIQQIIQSMKDVRQSEVSNIGPNEAQSGPEKWTVCSRGNAGNELRYFTFFLKGETVATWRPAVINDKCETRRFSPF